MKYEYKFVVTIVTPSVAITQDFKLRDYSSVELWIKAVHDWIDEGKRK